MLRVEVFKQKVQGESISTCTCQQELTWSSEIKCKPSFAIPKTNTYKYLHGRVCVCVFEHKVQGQSISTCVSQQLNLPEVQRSSVNHHLQYLFWRVCIYEYAFKCARVCVYSNKRCKERASVHEFLNKRTYLKFRDQV